MFDLDGFKNYNDNFGHLAGDTLLAHFGRRLEHAIGREGSVYRLGGDEFCALLRGEPDDTYDRVAACAAALLLGGEGFAVSASYGRVAVPREADTPTRALRLADDRMYAHKDRSRGSARQQTHDVLLGLLLEREPQLHDHLRQVGRLAAVVGRRLGMTAEQLDELRRAADLHDIGKAAIPDSILSKPSPLDEHELSFMRRHTLIGERILSAAPALAPVAAHVRSSHERWDGQGYPDGLTGEAIPLGARVIAVCDAFDAITTDRPYGEARSVEEALDELRRGSGTQFDPRVVETFTLCWQGGLGLELPAERGVDRSRLPRRSGADVSSRGG
jgi:diguanylate cyclase (GGDEF)-like protein